MSAINFVLCMIGHSRSVYSAFQINQPQTKYHNNVEANKRIASTLWCGLLAQKAL